MPVSRPWQRTLRDVFVGWHLACVTLLSFPAPVGARKESVWSDELLVAQIAAWTAPMVSLGFDVTPASLTDLAKKGSFAVLDVRDVVVAPFRPYTAVFGTGQGWHMFGSVNPRPARLRIQVKRGVTPFETVYLARDPEFHWLATKLDQERMRAATNPWSWGLARGPYRQFCGWIAAEAKRDFPDAHAVQCEMMAALLPTPEQLRAGDSNPEQARWRETVELTHIAAAQ